MGWGTGFQLKNSNFKIGKKKKREKYGTLQIFIFIFNFSDYRCPIYQLILKIFQVWDGQEAEFSNDKQIFETSSGKREKKAVCNILNFSNSSFPIYQFHLRNFKLCGEGGRVLLKLKVPKSSNKNENTTFLNAINFVYS